MRSTGSGAGGHRAWHHISLASRMGKKDQASFFTKTGLLHGPDRDAVITEDLGHRRQHAGLVDHFKAQVEGRSQLGRRSNRDRTTSWCRRRRS